MSGAAQSAACASSTCEAALAGPFDLDLAAGECLAITGPSGSGKSLFLRMVADLDPSQGEVFLDGVERRSLPAPAWRRRVVYSAAEPGWWTNGVADHFRGEAMEFARAMAPRLGLAPGVAGWAGGAAFHRRAPAPGADPRVGAALAGAAAGRGRPAHWTRTAPQLVEDVLRERLAAAVTIAMVTHSAAQAARLGHRQLRMANRRLVPA